MNTFGNSLTISPTYPCGHLPVPSCWQAGEGRLLQKETSHLPLGKGASDVFFFSPDRGGSPKRLHWPNLFRLDYTRFTGEAELQVATCSHPVCLNMGLIKPWRGSTPIMGKAKTGGTTQIDKDTLIVNNISSIGKGNESK